MVYTEGMTFNFRHARSAILSAPRQACRENRTAMLRKYRIKPLAGAILMALSAVSWGDIYKYEDLEGNMVYSDRPMKGHYRLLGKSDTPGDGVTVTLGHYQLRWAWDEAETWVKQGQRSPGRIDIASSNVNARKYKSLIDAAARQAGLDKNLLHAVVLAESAYDPRALSPAGAAGLMQLMPATAERYGVTDRYNPAQSLQGGAAYLSDLLELFNNDIRLAVAAYNAGENAVVRYGRKIPPYRETQNYVRKVMSFYTANLGDQISMRD